MTQTSPVPPSDAAPVKGSVLIVEDNETARKQLQTLLAAGPGLVVDTASNGSEALQKLSAQRFSVVITDLKMPRVSGRNCWKRFRNAACPRPSS